MRLAICVFGLLALVARPAHADIIGKATVVDGNTLEIAGERIRLYGIAAPEPDQTCRWPNKAIPGGPGLFRQCRKRALANHSRLTAIALGGYLHGRVS